MAFSGAGPGRPKGVPNKLTAALKEALANAFEEVGGQAYLVKVAQEDPRTFCTLLGKAMPTAIEGGDGEPVKAVIEVITNVPRRPSAD